MNRRWPGSSPAAILALVAIVAAPWLAYGADRVVICEEFTATS